MINKSLKKLIKESVGYVYYNTYKKYCNNTGNKTLIYHAFGSKLKHDTYGISISINKFKDQMLPTKWYKEIIDRYVYPLDNGDPGINIAEYIKSI